MNKSCRGLKEKNRLPEISTPKNNLTCKVKKEKAEDFMSFVKDR